MGKEGARKDLQGSTKNGMWCAYGKATWNACPSCAPSTPLSSNLVRAYDNCSSLLDVGIKSSKATSPIAMEW